MIIKLRGSIYAGREIEMDELKATIKVYNLDLTVAFIYILTSIVIDGRIIYQYAATDGTQLHHEAQLY